MRPTLADTLRFSPKPSSSPQAEAVKPIDATAAHSTATDTAAPASVVFPPASPDDAEADALRDFILGLGWKIEGLSPRPNGRQWWHITAIAAEHYLQVNDAGFVKASPTITPTIVATEASGANAGNSGRSSAAQYGSAEVPQSAIEPQRTTLAPCGAIAENASGNMVTFGPEWRLDVQAAKEKRSIA